MAILPCADQNKSGTENMAGIIKGAGQILADGNGMAVGVPVKQLQGIISIRDSIQRLDFFQVMGFNQLIDDINVQIVTVFL